MRFHRPLGLVWARLFGVLTLLFTAPLAHAQLDTLRVYGNGNGPSIDGTVTASADFTNAASGQYSITAGGSDIWGSSDNGVFIHEAGATTAGDFTAIVRSVSFGGPDPLAGEWGRTGPMARAGDGSAANAANVMTTQKSGSGIGMVFQGRNSNGGDTDRSGLNGDFPNSGGASAAAGVPVWMALSRTTVEEYDVFIGHWAFDDGAGNPGAWSEPAVRFVTPDLSGPLTVGLAHQSHSIPRVNSWNADNWSLGAFDTTLPAIDTESNTGRFTYAQQPDGTWNKLELHQNWTPTNYEAALNDAVAKGGHLFTPRSRMENAAAGGLVAGTSAWIGLNDNATEGDWKLIDGAMESVWAGMGSDAGGTPVAGAYHNWNGGGEPNNAGAGENGGQILATGRWNDNNHVGASLPYIVEYDTGLATQPDPAPGLPQGALAAWNIRRTATSGGIENVRGVEAVLYSAQHATADYQSPAINFRDQNSGDGLVVGGTPFPGDDPGNSDENNFALYARAKVKIDVENDYTFGFYGDDGSELQIKGQNFISSTNIGDGGNINLLESNLPAVAHDGDRIAYPNPTGSGSVLGVVHLTPGVYDLTYTFYENGGGAHAEVFAAPGAHTAFDASVFRAVGQPAAPRNLVLDGPATVANIYATPPAIDNEIAIDGNPANLVGTAFAGDQIVNNPGGLDEYVGEVTTLILVEGEDGSVGSICCGAPGAGDGPPLPGPSIATTHQMPGIAATGVGDNYVSGFAGVLNVAEAGQYTIAGLADDGMAIRLFDLTTDETIPFTEISGANGNRTSIVGGEAHADFYTGNTNLTALIDLPAGQVGIQGVHFEGGSGSYFQVWGASGNHVGAFNTTLFYPISTLSELYEPGLEVVPEPTSLALAGFGLALLGLMRRRRK